ncbi:Pre-mRNA-splicing factor cwc26 [Hypoxylon texense]
MAPDTFHQFPWLPLEIRNEIYLFATPPRIVHVQTERKEDDEQEFLEWFANLVPSQTAQIKLHPSLAYFVHNWGRHVLSYNDRSSQPTLESYGFTNSRPVRNLWDNPQISLNWLLEHPTIAYQLLRKSNVYSTAPIPALLHTCSESRALLIRAGYRLAFGTRNHEPHTWFHYQNDILYLDSDDRPKSEPLDSPTPLSHSEWIVGEIDTQSLQQVRKVALVGAFYMSSYQPWGPEISNTVRLLPRLDMLYIVEWTEYSLDRLLRKRSYSSSSTSQSTETGLRSKTYAREPWRCLPVEEVDGVLSIIGEYPSRIAQSRHGQLVFMQGFKSFRGLSGQYFPGLLDQLTEYLEGEREKAVQRERAVPWQIPKVDIVHVCTEPVARRLFEERHRIWNKLVLLKRRQALWEERQSKHQGRRNERQNRRQSERPSSPFNLSQLEIFNTGDTPLSPTELELQDDWEAFHDAHDNYEEWEPPGYNIEELVKEWTIFPPRQELSLEP